MVDYKYQVVNINNKLTMERILSEVTVKELDGCLKKILEMIENKQLGHFYLHQLGQFAREEPVNVLTKKWLTDLRMPFVWERAEKHFGQTNKLWYNEPQWPFQICVLPIGGINNSNFRVNWSSKYPSHPELKQMTENFKNFNLPSKSKKLFLIRLQTKFLNLGSEASLAKVNCDHPELNLYLCPPETAFFTHFLVNNYADRNPTFFSTNFCKPETLKEEKRLFYFSAVGGYDTSVYLGQIDYSKSSGEFPDEKNNYWIFQCLTP